MNLTDWLQHLNALWTAELHAMLDGTRGPLELFLNCFPFFLSLLWSLSALSALGFGIFSSRQIKGECPPRFTVLVPFHGNSKAALSTAWSLAAVLPAPEEIILIDDGSPGSLMNSSLLPPGARLLHLPSNVGKAAALNHALREAHSEIIVCLDSDTLVETADWHRMLGRFADQPKLGALTGKIRPAHTGNLAQILQALDYLAVICLVKFAENTWGGITTVSGAWVAFRREAVLECGGWNESSSTEDIDLSWRLQTGGWRVGYDRSWTARVEMARTWRALWLQRRRWACGMARALRDHFVGILKPRATHKPAAFIAMLSAVWMWLAAGVLARKIFFWAFSPDSSLVPASIGWVEAHMLTICLCTAAFFLQIFAGIAVDRGPWRRYPLLVLVSPLYVVYFWFVLFSSFVFGFTRGFFRLDSGLWKPTALREKSLHSRPVEKIVAEAPVHAPIVTPNSSGEH